MGKLKLHNRHKTLGISLVGMGWGGVGLQSPKG